MHMTTRFFAFTAILPVLAALGCGGEPLTVDKTNDATPEEIPGGGVGSGAVDGKINVYAIDGVTDAPIAGASVRIGEADAAKPLMGTTDATGLVTFKDSSLKGAQSITVTAPNYVATTWLGVNGANVTIPIGPAKPPEIETANVSGTIAGWDMLMPPSKHLYIAFVGSSWTGKLGDPSNEIKQPMSGTQIPLNACIRLPPEIPQSIPCDWKLVTRTGKQILFGIIVDVDTKGTMVETDDTRTFYGYAFKTGLDLKAGDTSTGQSLDVFPAENLVPLSVTLPAVPDGMDESAAIPLLNMGDEGQIPFYFGNELPITKIPTLTGIFTTGRHDVIARANVKGKQVPSTVTITRGADVSKTVTLPSYQPTPTDPGATAGVYSFKPVAGATLHSVKFELPAGNRVWNVALYDGRTSFSLPTLSPDPLPVGSLNMRVEALTVPGVKLQDFDLKSAADQVSAVSENGIAITH